MYNNFYGFNKNPFTLNPDTDFLFLREKHNSLLSNLKNGLSNQFGMMVVTGDMGTGKSVLAQSLLNQLDPQYTAALLATTQYVTLEEMLKNIFIAFGIKNHINHSTELSNLLFENFLTTEFWNEKKVLLIIDDAHNLSVDLLENIRLLSNFTINNKQIIQFILVGQKSLIDSLEIPELGQLINSISLFEELPPLNLKETHGYIHHRLKNAGAAGDEPFFTQKAYDSIYELSSGIPSLINQLCELSLITAFSKKIKPIDSELIEAVANVKNRVTIPVEEQNPTNISQQAKFSERKIPTNTMTTFTDQVDQNESEVTQINHQETSSVIEEFATEIISEEIEDLVEDDEPVKNDSSAEIKPAVFTALPDIHPLDKTDILKKDSFPTNEKLKTGQNTSKHPSSKTPNKWLIVTVALLCLANTTLYLYSKRVAKKDKRFAETALTGSQSSHSAEKAKADNIDQQFASAIAPLTAPSLITEQKIDLKIAKDVQDSSTRSLSSSGPVTLFQQTAAIVSGSQNNPLSSDKKDATQKVDTAKTAEQLLLQNKKAKKLIRRAKRQFSKMYLTTPKRYNALDTYQQILEFDPQYQPALDGLKKIKDLYIYWAKRDLRRKRFRQAERFVRKALLAAPNDPQLNTLLETIAVQSAPRN